jgi:hypothetical protein
MLYICACGSGLAAEAIAAKRYAVTDGALRRLIRIRMKSWGQCMEATTTLSIGYTVLDVPPK